jgi:hypothetical protein
MQASQRIDPRVINLARAVVVMQVAGYGARGCLGRGGIGLLQEQLSSIAEKDKKQAREPILVIRDGMVSKSKETIERRKMVRFGLIPTTIERDSDRVEATHPRSLV